MVLEWREMLIGLLIGMSVTMDVVCVAVVHLVLS